MAGMLLKNGFKAKGRKITNFFEGFEATQLLHRFYNFGRLVTESQDFKKF